MNRKRLAHVVATGGVAVVTLYTLSVVADRWPSSPVAQLLATIRGQKGRAS